MVMQQTVLQCHFLENVSKRPTFYLLIIYIIIAVWLVVVLFKLLRDRPFLMIPYPELSLYLLKDKLLYYILHLEIIYLVILTKIYFPFCFSLQFYNPKCSLAALITEKSVQMKYISELVSDPSPIIYK